jgi:Pyridoxamine 5'-phosphate oxidase
VTGRVAVVAEVIAAGAADAAPIDWEEAVRLFAAERWYWVATTGDQGRPHLRPVLAVYLDERIYSTTNPAARKGRNLTRRPSAAFAARAPAIDIVIEGTVTWIDDRQQLQRVSDAYQDKYSWPVTVTNDSAFDAPYAAPTAGPPPYRVYQLTPTVAYAFGTGNNLGERSTRYRFDFSFPRAMTESGGCT